jgi:hypothetical protein
MDWIRIPIGSGVFAPSNALISAALQAQNGSERSSHAYTLCCT